VTGAADHQQGVGMVDATAGALERFVTDHYGRLIRLAYLICRDRTNAEDAVQAALERAWRARASVQTPDSLRAWLDRIVVREAARISKPRGPVQELMPEHRAPGSTADDTAAVRIAMSRLSVDHRAAVVLHLYAGYTVAATADLLDIPQETVRSRLRVARQQLRRLLGEEGER
jgi:RNA polymerase sigma-70 factor (ECF subfamily)